MVKVKEGFIRSLFHFSKAEAFDLFKKAKVLFQEPLLEIRSASRSGPHGRFLIVIPKRVGSAPQRNLIRRRIKSIVYEAALYKKDFDYLILIKPSEKIPSFDYLKKTLTGIP